jgi:hypothetical protein
MNVLPIIYKGLVRRERCTLEDVPEEYREETKSLLESQDSPDKSIKDTIKPETIEDNKIGAINIPNIDEYSISVSKMITDRKYVLTIQYEGIFTKDLFSQAPEDVIYKIQRIENKYMQFEEDLKVSINTIDNNCVLTLEGTPKYESDERFIILRIDVGIESSNYEDMHFTVYLYSK